MPFPVERDVQKSMSRTCRTIKLAGSDTQDQRLRIGKIHADQGFPVNGKTAAKLLFQGRYGRVDTTVGVAMEPAVAVRQTFRVLHALQAVLSSA
ncbi:hypothetical protein AYO40_00355 [Planctomycetaceae bacterium SCGC AG-212-D15]|nr:hypothetical protein AYO40_00355 [Planctomycetaceae bacterium SCGC AG-212-D15]